MKWTLLALLVSITSVTMAQKIEIVSPVNYLALGDSYTVGESVSSQLTWPSQLHKALTDRGYSVNKTTIIAKTGWRTDQLIEAITRENPQNNTLVSLLIGVNNQYQGRPIESMQQDFKCLLAEAVTRAGGSKKQVFVVSIPDYAFTPFGQTRDHERITAELNQYNQWQAEYCRTEGIAWVDITSISRLGLEQPELVASDGLHPSAEQYERWVEKILKELFD